MVSLYILIPIALMLTGVAICLYIWSVNNNQFEDLDNEASRILFDDEAEINSPDRRNIATIGDAKERDK